MALLVEVHSGPDHWLGSYGPLLVMYWLGIIDPAVCRTVTKVARSFGAKQRGGQTSVISVSFATTAPPSTEARHALAALIRDTDHCVERLAVVREADGFTSAIVSSIMSAVQMLARPNAPHRYFRRLDEAIPWATAALHDFEFGEVKAAEAVEILNRQLEMIRTRYKSAS